MRFIKITGLCLVAMVTMSMALAVSASAAPHWLVCLPFVTGSTATRYTEHQCKTASGSGGWEWSELKNTELPVITHGSLKLEAKSLIGEVSVSCSGEDKGTIGPGNKSKTTEITNIQCTKGENCEKIDGTGAAVPLNLPWTSELKETEGKIHGTITNGKTGTEAPGWEVICTVVKKEETNKCTSEKGLVVLENKDTPGTEAELLVLANFINPNKPKANCTATGNETGNVSGSIATLLANGWGLRVSK